MADLQMVRQYLDGWKDPRRGKLVSALGEDQQKAVQAFVESLDAMPVSPRLAEVCAVVRFVVGPSTDVIFRKVSIGAESQQGALLFTDGLIKKEIVMTVLEMLTIHLRHEPVPAEPSALEEFLRRRALVSTEVTAETTLGGVIAALLSGDSVLLVEGLDRGLRMSTRGWEHRQPEEPVTEPAVRGPKEGFTETVAVNLSLVRRRIQDPRLRMETLTVGARSHTTVALLYMAGLTLPELVDEVRSRLKSVDVDALIESGMLEELIADTTLTPFPLMRATERPDVVAPAILEGRVAILVDGTPHALVVPTFFAEGMQAVEDYYLRWPYASFIRLVRYMYLLVALLGPAVYIALLSYHHEMLPTNLLLSIMGSREGVPFPALVEAILMELSFEVLREAGVRLPKNVGQAVSIVGGLVIGEAAVKAGLVSPAMVIVVSLTGISSFVIPLYGSALAIRLLRFPMMLLAGTLGFLGIVLGLIALSVHLGSLRSFGVPYMSPTMPPAWDDMKDMLIRAPWWMMRKRPQQVPMLDRRRMGSDQAPQPPGEGGDVSA